MYRLNEHKEHISELNALAARGETATSEAVRQSAVCGVLCSLKELDASFSSGVEGYGLTLEGMALLTEIVRDASSIRTLNIMDTALWRAIPTIANLTTLTELDISHNIYQSKVKPGFADPLLPALITALEALQQLEVLNLSHNYLRYENQPAGGGRAIPIIPSLRELDVSSCHLGENSLEALSALTSLRVLNISKNSLNDLFLGEEGIKKLAKALQQLQALEVLIMSKNGCGWKELLIILDELRLTELDISGNYFAKPEAVGVEVLNHEISKLPLTRLNISGNMIKVEDLARAWAQKPAMIFLNIRDNIFTPSKVIEIFEEGKIFQEIQYKEAITELEIFSGKVEEIEKIIQIIAGYAAGCVLELSGNETEPDNIPAAPSGEDEAAAAAMRPSGEAGPFDISEWCLIS